jgi:hypothetical protein
LETKGTCQKKKKKKRGLPSKKTQIMLSLRKTVIQTRSLYAPCLQKLYSTKEITKDIEPIQSFKDKDGITEVYVVHRSKSGRFKKHNKVPLSQRLKSLNVPSNDETWNEIPKDKTYERKFFD